MTRAPARLKLGSSGRLAAARVQIGEAGNKGVNAPLGQIILPRLGWHARSLSPPALGQGGASPESPPSLLLLLLRLRYLLPLLLLLFCFVIICLVLLSLLILLSIIHFSLRLAFPFFPFLSTLLLLNFFIRLLSPPLPPPPTPLFRT